MGNFKGSPSNLGPDVIVGGEITIKEQANAESDVSGQGQIWIKSSDNELYFTDESGNDVQITSGGSLNSGGGGTLAGLGSTDNAVLRANGTGGETAQGSGVVIDDSNNVTGVTSLTAGTLVISDDQIQMTPSTDDTVTISAATNGALNITTVDTAAAAANIQITADGTAELAGTTVTLDSGGNVVLSAAGGNVTMDDGSTTIFDFDAANTALTIHDDQDTGDKLTITVAQHGATTIATVDDDATAAHLTLDADGDVVLSAAGGNVTMDDGSTTIFDFNTADTTLTIHDDQDTGDKLTITVAQHGATTIATVDDDAAAAHLTLNPDGDIRIPDSLNLSLGDSQDLTLKHDGHNRIIGTTGHIIVDNQVADQSIKMVLGSDNANTDFRVQNNSNRVAFEVDGEGDILLSGSANANVTWDRSAGSLKFVDSAQVQFGDSQDLSIKHASGHNSIIGTTGNIVIDNQATSNAVKVRLGTDTSATDFRVQGAGNDSQLIFKADGAGDISILQDGAAMKFGADGEVTLTHVHNTGLLLSDDSGVGTTKLMFGDSACFVQQQADGQLGIDADSIINVTAPTVDIDASTAVTVDTDTMTIASANSADPLVIIKNTTNDAVGSRLRFVKDKGAAGAANDVSGIIEFFADDANQDNICFASITGSVAVHTNGQEGGKLSFGVAEHDGTMTDGLVLTDGSADGEIDVTIGAGAASVITVPGTMDIAGAVDIAGDLTLSAGADGALVFGNAGENSIKIPDNQASALIVEQADNAYMTFNTTDGQEAVQANQTLQIMDDTKLMFGSGGDATIEYDEDGTDSLIIDSGAAPVLITSSTTEKPTLELKNTTAGDGATGPLLLFTKEPSNNVGEADNVILGGLQFKGIDSGNNMTTYGQLTLKSSDKTNADEGGLFEFRVMAGGRAGTADLTNLFAIGGEDQNADDGSAVVVNEDGIDCDFRVEGDAETHLLFVEAANDRISIGDSTDSPAALLEITNASDHGVPLVQLNNNDVDKVALDINAANTTANIIDIVADDCLTTGKVLHMDVNDASTSAITPEYVHFDFDKDGVVANGQTSVFTGFDIDMNDGATNDSGATVTMVGLDVDIASTNAQGTTSNTGINLNVSGATTNFAMVVEAGVVHIKDDQQLIFGDGFDVSVKYDEAGIDALLIDGDTAIADDKKLFFGSGKDASIEYDEDGTDELIITLPTGGGDISMPDNDGAALEIKTTDHTYITFATTNGQEGVVFGRDVQVLDDLKLRFGTDADASIEFDEDGNDALTIDIGQDKDLIITGNDNGSAITALQIDMSEDGTITTGAAPGAARAYTRANVAKTNINHNTAQEVFSVTVPNDEHAAALKVIGVATNTGATSAMSFEFIIAFSRVQNALGFATVSTVTTTGPTNGSAGDRIISIAAACTKENGSNSEAQRFDVKITPQTQDSSNNIRITAFAELINTNASGVTLKPFN